MLYVYYGDSIKARAKVRATTKGMLEKNPEALFLRITDENFSDFNLGELTEAQALFKNAYIVLLDNLLAASEARESVLEFIKEITTSPNIFFLLEEKPDAKTLKKLKKHANKTQQFTHVRGASSHMCVERFNTFALADALGEGDKKRLWQLFWAAKHAGISDEEMQGVLFWQAKVMYLASRASSAGAAGLKSFVYNKAKRFAERKSEQELRGTLNTLVSLPHESRRKSLPLAIGLEQFILKT